MALELAASWLKVLACRDIVNEIESSLDFLASEQRAFLSRHRSVRAVFNHTWHMLNEAEREVFRKLAVFRGGFERDAAEQVSGASLDILAGLANKSLVWIDERGRFHLHELLRQYAKEQLETSGKTQVICEAHSRYYATFMKQREPDIKGRRQSDALTEIEADFENVRATWDWAVLEKKYMFLDDMLECLFWVCFMRTRYFDGEAFFKHSYKTLLSDTTDTTHPLFTRLVTRSIFLRRVQLGYFDSPDVIKTQLTISLEIARQFDNLYEIAINEALRGWLISSEYDIDKGIDILRDCLAHCVNIDDTFTHAWVIHILGMQYEISGHLNSDIDFYQQSLDMRHSIGDIHGSIYALFNLSDAELWRGNYAAYERHIHDILQLAQGPYKEFAIMALRYLARNDFLKGDFYNSHKTASKNLTLSEQLDYDRDESEFLSTLACVATMEANYHEAITLGRRSRQIAKHEDSIFWAEWALSLALYGLENYEECQKHNRLALQTALKRHATGALTWCLPTAAMLLIQKNDILKGVELLALAYEHPASATGWLDKWSLFTQLRADLEAELGHDKFNAAWQRGKTLDIETVVASLLIEDETPNISPQQQANKMLVEPLSERELEVLMLIAQGLSNRDIAEKLVLSIGTIKAHTSNIYGKLGVNKRVQALLRAKEFHLI